MSLALRELRGRVPWLGGWKDCDCKDCSQKRPPTNAAVPWGISVVAVRAQGLALGSTAGGPDDHDAG